MRKWMSERLKRRKKEPEKAGTDPAQAPLQPAFYDTEPVHPEPDTQRQAAAAPPQPESAHELPSVEPQPVQPRQAENGDVAKRRRRRGRGGRGRGRNGAPPVESAGTGGEAPPLQTASKQSPAPPAVASHGRATAKAPAPP